MIDDVAGNASPTRVSANAAPGPIEFCCSQMPRWQPMQVTGAEIVTFVADTDNENAAAAASPPDSTSPLLAGPDTDRMTAALAAVAANAADRQPQKAPASQRPMRTRQ